MNPLKQPLHLKVCILLCVCIFTCCVCIESVSNEETQVQEESTSTIKPAEQSNEAAAGKFEAVTPKSDTDHSSKNNGIHHTCILILYILCSFIW